MDQVSVSLSSSSMDRIRQLQRHFAPVVAFSDSELIALLVDCSLGLVNLEESLLEDVREYRLQQIVRS